MGLFELLTILILIGVLLYVANTLPMDPAMKVILRGVVLVVVILWLVRLFVGDVPLPYLHFRH